MKVIIITMLICWVISFIGFYFREDTNRDGWILIISPLYIIPFIIIKIQESIKDGKRTHCIKGCKLNNRFSLWMNYNKPENMYWVKVLKDNWAYPSTEIELYAGNNKKEAFKIYNEYAKMTEDDLIVVFNREEARYEMYKRMM